MKAATIMLVDDHPIVREGYRRLLERQGLTVVAEAENAQEAYRAYRIFAPSLTLMDLDLPGAGGIEALRHIRQWDDAARIIIVSLHTSTALAIKAFEAGAVGYVTKASGARELIAAAQAVLSGSRRSISHDLAAALADERLASPSSIVAAMSPREVEIFRMLARGHHDRAIADELHLSLKTVRNYHYEIKQKLGIGNDANLVWLAVEAGLIDLSPSRPRTSQSQERHLIDLRQDETGRSD